MKLAPTKLNYTKLLHYITLHYNITLHYTITRHFSWIQNTIFHYTTPHYTTPHCTTLHYTTLHYTTLHHTTLHYTTLILWNYPMDLTSGRSILLGMYSWRHFHVQLWSFFLSLSNKCVEWHHHHTNVQWCVLTSSKKRTNVISCMLYFLVPFRS